MALIGIFERSPLIGILGASSIFLTACYSVYLYNRVSFGTYSEHLKPIKDIDRREFIVLFSLLIPTILMGIWPNFILDSLHPSVSDLIYIFLQLKYLTSLIPVLLHNLNRKGCKVGKGQNMQKMLNKQNS